MKFTKYIAASLLITSLGTAITPLISSSSVYADNIETVTNNTDNIVEKDGYRIFLIDGKIYKLPSNSSTPTSEEISAMKQERGKWSSAIKAIKAGYSRVPEPVKKYIARFIGLDAILGTLDHWTGWIEDGIYQACKSVGMPDWMAWTVAKALTMIAL